MFCKQSCPETIQCEPRMRGHAAMQVIESVMQRRSAEFARLKSGDAQSLLPECMLMAEHIQSIPAQYRTKIDTLRYQCLRACERSDSPDAMCELEKLAALAIEWAAELRAMSLHARARR